MKVLIVGSGGREHALGWAIRRSPRCELLYTAPGNGGTASIGENVPIDPTDLDGLIDFAKEKGVDLTVVGPEAPLVAGIVNRFASEGLWCFGPSREAAQLEGSKVFAKQFMKRHGIPSADFEVFESPEDARRYIRQRTPPLVVKADGLAQGKGVVVAQTREAALEAIEASMVERKFGASGERVVVESLLEGEEVSIHAICGGGRALLLPASQDHKRIYDGDRGPNTGGMGAYAPVPQLSLADQSRIVESIIEPTLRGMESEGIPFAGLLYAGLMLTREGPKVLEFNVRFGDPETQAVIPLVSGDLLEVLSRAAQGDPPESIPIREREAAAAVVVASEGYPGSYQKGFEIEGLSSIEDQSRVVFHAGTRKTESGFVTSGGRVLAVTAWAPDLKGALSRAYEGVEKVKFTGAYWRSDIGRRALSHVA